jgi:hypothetical protein
VAETIKLQTIVDSHARSIFSLRDAVYAAHAGLMGLDELEWQQYQAGLMPSPRTTNRPASYHETVMASKNWMIASALRDLVAQQALFLEKIRQFLEFAEVVSTDKTEEEKKREILNRVQEIPANAKDSIENLKRLLGSHFNHSEELKSLLALNVVFSARASHIEMSLAKEPLTIHLCMPRFKQPTAGDLKLDYEIERTESHFPTYDAVQVTPELLYRIFFTAFSICRNVTEACQKKFSDKNPQTSPATRNNQA